MNKIVKIVALMALLGIALASVATIPDRMTTVIELPSGADMQPGNVVAQGPQQIPVSQPPGTPAATEDRDTIPEVRP